MYLAEQLTHLARRGVIFSLERDKFLGRMFHARRVAYWVESEHFLDDVGGKFELIESVRVVLQHPESRIDALSEYCVVLFAQLSDNFRMNRKPRR
jgi:hypothetical protein